MSDSESNSSSELSDIDSQRSTSPPQTSPPIVPKRNLHETNLPTKERALPHVPPPKSVPLTHDELFDRSTNLPNVELLKKHLFDEGKLLKEDVLEIVTRATTLFIEEPNILIVKEPVTSMRLFVFFQYCFSFS
jgi:hypothetical protein